jgi:hypothetical protein
MSAQGNLTMTLPDATFDVYFASDDQIIECTACDPDAGEPADWPAWTDACRWEPTPDDVAWLNTSPPPISGGAPEWEPSEADWADYHEHCLEVERLDALRRMEDHEHELRLRYGG